MPPVDDFMRIAGTFTTLPGQWSIRRHGYWTDDCEALIRPLL
jgi:hypothetical protein